MQLIAATANDVNILPKCTANIATTKEWVSPMLAPNQAIENVAAKQVKPLVKIFFLHYFFIYLILAHQ